MIGPDPRTVLGLTAESWAIGVLVLVVCAALVAGCYQDVVDLLRSLSAVKVRVPVPVRSSRAFREARNARRGVWR